MGFFLRHRCSWNYLGWVFLFQCFIKPQFFLNENAVSQTKCAYAYIQYIFYAFPPSLGLNAFLQIPFYQKSYWVYGLIKLVCLKKKKLFKKCTFQRYCRAKLLCIMQFFVNNYVSLQEKVIKILVLASENCVSRLGLEVPEGLFYYSVKCALVLPAAALQYCFQM